MPAVLHQDTQFSGVSAPTAQPMVSPVPAPRAAVTDSSSGSVDEFCASPYITDQLVLSMISIV
jgi:hypothetical protein